MKINKTGANKSGVSHPTASGSGKTLSERTYKTALSAMKQAIRKDDRGSSGKLVERKK